ncbi:hypothetical protein IWX63_003198 [Arthrobacter sp. CAN_A2]|uniref:cyclophilin-like fold protein n=1 Tax=Arthrobacter sp. CAN_A2 TaxID=2787718 RepID=UPI0018EFC8F0
MITGGGGEAIALDCDVSDSQDVMATLDQAWISLLEQFPLTLSLSDFGGQEKVAELPEPLDLDGAPAGSGAEPGMIGYYVPDQRLILYYDQVRYYAGVVPLGIFDDVPAVESLDGASTITVRPGG